MTCLSSPKRCDTGTSFRKGPMKQKKVILKRDDKAPPKEPSLLKHLSGKDGTTTSSILLQEEPPDQSPNRQAVPLDAPIKLPNQVSATIPCSIINDLDIMHTDLLCPDKFEERLGCLENYVEHNPCLRSHLEKKQENFSSTEIGTHQTDLYVENSMTAITHLSFAKEVEFMTGTKAENSGDISKAKFIPGRTRGYTVSRSKPFQGGGNVAGTETVPEPKLSQISNNCLNRATRDQGSFKEVHLNHQKEFWHETNFTRRPAQPFITAAWNYKKRFTEEEVMNFTSWRFPSPSVCEYRPLKEKLSQTKKRPGPK
ncbi:uncharacterized protein LOC117134197 [Brassica rapa]|uniref:uncharacterized protein LOC117134197 n=1 Tax=Brassica campestris TaxID=3711 RepID=UPI00142DB18E|nr:uncharacterized protein LOC117134197 [Brassica rapa]